VKNGTSTVQVFLVKDDGSTVFQLEVPYSRLKGNPYHGASKPYFWFGNREHHADCREGDLVTPCPAMESFWTNVTYEIGATSP
jgi:hypothetical protein